jgi:putative transposase
MITPSCARAREFTFTLHLRTRGEEVRQAARRAGAKARRWVVERTHSWLNRFRSILIQGAKKPANYLVLPPSPSASSAGVIPYRDRL